MRDLFDDDDDSNGKANEFAQMFEDSLSGVGKRLSPGDKIRGEVLTIGKEDVFVSTGTMSDGVVLKRDLLDADGNFKAQVGDFLDLFVTQVKGGQIFLSPKPTAKNMAEGLEDAFDMMLPVEGRVTETCNGGFRVSVMGKTAFCPISQIDTRRVEDPQSYIGKKFEFLITQYSERGRNIVVSRRKLLDEQKELSAGAFLDVHKPGDVVDGMITRLEKFGAFVELAPGLDGLCHISELSWSRVADPSEAVSLGQAVRVKILKVEQDGNRLNVSLSLKQVDSEPWAKLPEQLQENSIVEGRVTRCMKFGAFVEVAPGIEGLLPLSEMSYTKRVLRSDELIQEGQKISVMIKEIRLDDRKMLLSLRDAGEDPWAMVPHKFPEGSIAKGRVERREPYGLFVRLDDGVVGLLPKSKAQANPEFPFDKVKPGDEITVQINEIKIEERKISLGVPQDPDAEAWRGFSTPSVSKASLGTLGDQFKNMFDAGNKPVAGKKK